MYILGEIYQQLCRNTPIPPPESGGILGGKNGGIHVFVPDDGLETEGDHYRPNVDHLNTILHMWDKQGVRFYGIYHTHRAGGGGLSASDKRYICRIVKAVCDIGQVLYFPIIYPGENMTAFKARRQKDGVEIFQEPIILIK